MINFTILFGFCTKSSIKKAHDMFRLANNAQNISEQIKFLKKSMEYCYSYEVDFYLNYIYAKLSKNEQEKIIYYKKSLSILSYINNPEYKKKQYSIYKILSKLYLNKNPKKAKIYEAKAAQFTPPKEKNKTYLFFLLLILIGIILIVYILKHKKIINSKPK